MKDGQTAYNKRKHDAPFVEKDYRCRSIVFAACWYCAYGREKYVFDSALRRIIR